MNRVIEILKKEWQYLFGVVVVLYLVFQIVFYKQDFLVVLRSAGVFSLLFVVPGYFLMLHWVKKIDILERLIVGTAFAAALIGVISYYLGLLGITILYHTYLLPALLIMGGFILASQDQ